MWKHRRVFNELYSKSRLSSIFFFYRRNVSSFMTLSVYYNYWMSIYFFVSFFYCTVNCSENTICNTSTHLNSAAGMNIKNVEKKPVAVLELETRGGNMVFIYWEVVCRVMLKDISISDSTISIIKFPCLILHCWLIFHSKLYLLATTWHKETF